MRRLLHVRASARGGASHSRRFGGQLVAALQRRQRCTVITRDLAAEPLPYPGAAFVAASLRTEHSRGAAETAALALSEQLIRELEEADAVVIDTPMHNFTVPAVLKTWIDHVVRPHRTFRSSRTGKVGLLRDRPVYGVIACGGGVDAGQQPDHLTPYLLDVLATIGLVSVRILRLDRLARGEDALAEAGARAGAWIDHVVAAGDPGAQPAHRDALDRNDSGLSHAGPLAMDIREDDLTRAQTLDLLRIHLAGMHANSPPGHVFALDLSGLKRPDITVWSVWDGDTVCGIGALRQLDACVGEVKSMRTHPDHLRRGVGRRLLDHIITVARRRGLRRLSLETGSGEAFQPALRLYRQRGFVNGAAFGDYVASDFNQFLHLDIAPSPQPR